MTSSQANWVITLLAIIAAAGFLLVVLGCAIHAELIIARRDRRQGIPAAPEKPRPLALDGGPFQPSAVSRHRGFTGESRP